MAKCLACGERKGNRFCRAFDGNICSLCCGTKRQKEICCLDACEYLKKGSEYQSGREIDRRINSDLHAETGDVFEMDEVIPFVETLERFFIDRFYRGKEVNDNQIYQALTKIYAFQTGTQKSLEAETNAETLIFGKFQEVNGRFSNLSEGLKARAILRMIRSIKSSSGSVLGNWNYLEMIYSQQTGQGKWADLFRKLE